MVWAGAALAQNPVVPTPPTSPCDNSNRAANTAWVQTCGSANTIPVHYIGNGDYTAILNSAIAACQTAGGGTILFGPDQYSIAGSTSIVPGGCQIEGTGTPQGPSASGGKFSATIPALLLNGAYPLRLGSGSAMRHIAILNPTPLADSTSTLAGTLKYLSDFSGTAIQVAGHKVTIEDVFIVGYDTCYSNAGYDFPTIIGMMGSCASNSGKVAVSTSGVSGIGFFKNIRMRPEFPLNSVVTESFSVTDVTDNGSGVIKVSGTVPSDWATGQTVYVYNVGGFTGANNKWTIGGIGSGFLNLSGSQTGPAPTGTWANASYKLTVSSTQSLGIGQNVCPVSCAGIPTGDTIQYINWATGDIYITPNPTTHAETTEALNFTNPSYTSGGTVEITANQLYGTAYQSNNDDAVYYEAFGEYGYETCLHVTGTTSADSFTDGFCDGEAVRDPSEIGIEDDSSGTGPNRYTSLQVTSVMAPIWEHGSDRMLMSGIQIQDAASGNISIAHTSGLMTIAGSVERAGSGVSISAGGVAIADNGSSGSSLSMAGDQFANDAIVGDAAAVLPNVTLDTTLYSFTYPFGASTVAATNCGSLSGAAGCVVVTVGGTTHYVPYW